MRCDFDVCLGPWEHLGASPSTDSRHWGLSRQLGVITKGTPLCAGQRSVLPALWAFLPGKMEKLLVPSSSEYYLMTRPRNSPWTLELYHLSSEWPKTRGLGTSLPGRPFPLALSQARLPPPRLTRACRAVDTWNRWEAAFHWVTSSHVPFPPQRFQYVEVPGNHYIHMNQPQQVAGVISSFLQNKEGTPAPL